MKKIIIKFSSNNISKRQKKRITKNFENTIDDYLKIMNIKKGVVKND